MIACMSWCFFSFYLDKSYPHDMIRTDAREQTLDSFIVPPAIKQLSQHSKDSFAIVDTQGITSSSHKRKSDSVLSSATKKRKSRKVVQLTSVKTLLKTVRDKEHHGME